MNDPEQKNGDMTIECKRCGASVDEALQKGGCAINDRDCDEPFVVRHNIGKVICEARI